MIQINQRKFTKIKFKSKEKIKIKNSTKTKTGLSVYVLRSQIMFRVHCKCDVLGKYNKRQEKHTTNYIMTTTDNRKNSVETRVREIFSSKNLRVDLSKIYLHNQITMQKIRKRCINMCIFKKIHFFNLSSDLLLLLYAFCSLPFSLSSLFPFIYTTMTS